MTLNNYLKKKATLIKTWQVSLIYRNVWHKNANFSIPSPRLLEGSRIMKIHTGHKTTRNEAERGTHSTLMVYDGSWVSRAARASWARLRSACVPIFGEALHQMVHLVALAKGARLRSWPLDARQHGHHAAARARRRARRQSRSPRRRVACAAHIDARGR